MDLKKFRLSISQLAEEKEIPEEKVIEIIDEAIAAAYKKDYGKKGQKIEAKMDPRTGDLRFWQIKEVVDEDMILSEQEIGKLKDGKELKQKKIRFNPDRHILIEKAKKIDLDVEVGDKLKISLETRQDYGRIAAQTAKQVILQKLKEAEREMIHQEFKKKEGEIVSGTVQRIDEKRVYFDLGKTLGIMPKEEQISGEYYKIGQRFKLYLLRIEEGSRGPLIFLSRAFPKFVSKLFEIEVPEILAGQVEIISIAREPGFRTKVAVKSNSEDIDPIGSAIGQRGSRVSAVMSELGGEKIDIIKYSEKPEEYIANALSPAKVSSVKIMPDNKAICDVSEDQFSLAIGKNGQNVRLAAKLTGWKIEVGLVEEQKEENSFELPEDEKEKKDKTQESDKKAKKKRKVEDGNKNKD